MNTSHTTAMSVLPPFDSECDPFPLPPKAARTSTTLCLLDQLV